MAAAMTSGSALRIEGPGAEHCARCVGIASLADGVLVADSVAWARLLIATIC